MTEELRPTAFLDRDGVINVDHGYVHRADQLDWIDGAREAIAQLKAAGYLVIVVTNQAGIGRGYYDEATMHAFHSHIEDAIREAGGAIDAFYHCPFHAEAAVEHFRHPDHPDRKPNPGMLLRAMREHPVDPDRAFLIGDKPSDIAAAEAAGLPGYLFETGRLDTLVKKILRD